MTAQQRPAVGRSPAAAGHRPRGTATATVQLGAADIFEAGAAHHRAGRLAEAEAHYRRILAALPDHADALHLLGVISCQLGRHETAIELIGRAINQNGNHSSYHGSYGVALYNLKRLDEAVASYDRALALKPDFVEVLNNRGGALQVLGRFAEALESYDRVLTLQPDLAEAYYNRGLTLQQLSRFAEALESYDRALAVKPDYAAVHYDRGNTLLTLERSAEAVESYDRALMLRPDHTEALNNRGLALHQLKRFDEAVESYDGALALRPGHAGALNNRGRALQRLKRLDEAQENYNRALVLSPHFAEALSNRGNTLQSLGRFLEAVESYDRALALRPDWAEAHYNRGETLQALGRFDDAVENYDRALALRPDLAEAHYNRGNALRRLECLDEAVASYDRALSLRPDHAVAHFNRGLTLRTLGRVTEAVESYDRALSIQPDHAAALNARGSALRVLERFGEALESYDRALVFWPDHAGVHYNRGTTLRRQGRLDEAVASFGQAAALQPVFVADWVNAKRSISDWSNYWADESRARNAIKGQSSVTFPFILLTLSSTPEEQFDCARRVAAGIAVRASAIIPRRKPRADARIRLGYLSADFHQHAIAYLIAGLIERHDRTRFDVVGYSYGRDDGSTMRARLTAAFDRFVDLDGTPHKQAARLIHADAVDILIDLTGLTRDSRTAILAYRPAPIQVNYLGYPGTSGADFIDYIVVDPFVVPGDHQRFFSERLVHLPDCYQCNDDQRVIAERTPSRAECGLPPEGFVFCCFNDSYKITPTFFDVWMRLLGAVPASVLWLLNANPWAKNNLAREAAARGVAPERLVFAPRRAVPEHLARHRLADLFLDTLPYNAHTTSSDALWAGLPVLTCAGISFPGRVAGSLLRAVGLPELVTTSLAEYEALALQLARDAGRLGGLRTRLAQNRLTHPLFDTKRYTRHLEAAYWRMSEIRRAGRPPTAFSVSLSGDISQAGRGAGG